MMLQGSAGGNQFIPGDASTNDFLVEVAAGIRELEKWWSDTEKEVDLGQIVVSTKRVGDRISVTVEGIPKERTS